MEQQTIALFTHCQDSFGSQLVEVFKDTPPRFVYPSTHDSTAAVESVLGKKVTIVIIDTMSISKEMATELINALIKKTDARLYTHSGEDLNIMGVTHLKDFAELVK